MAKMTKNKAFFDLSKAISTLYFILAILPYNESYQVGRLLTHKNGTQFGNGSV